MKVLKYKIVQTTMDYKIYALIPQYKSRRKKGFWGWFSSEWYYDESDPIWRAIDTEGHIKQFYGYPFYGSDASFNKWEDAKLFIERLKANQTETIIDP